MFHLYAPKLRTERVDLIFTDWLLTDTFPEPKLVPLLVAVTFGIGARLGGGGGGFDLLIQQQMRTTCQNRILKKEFF